MPLGIVQNCKSDVAKVDRSTLLDDERFGSADVFRLWFGKVRLLRWRWISVYPIPLMLWRNGPADATACRRPDANF
jgi:hypothetical protein